MNDVGQVAIWVRLATAYGIVVGATISMYYDWNFVVSGSMINEFHPSPYVS